MVQHATASDWSSACTLIDSNAQTIKYRVANASVVAQVMPINPHGGEGEWGPEFPVTPEDGAYAQCMGVRFKDLTPGTHAEVVAQSFSESDPQPLGAIPFTETLLTSGQTSGGSSSNVSGDVVLSAAATRAGAVLCDGATYDSVADPTFAALYAAIGTTYGGTGPSSFKVPDMQGRVPVVKGTHADVATLGNNDGVALASRRPSHHHTAGFSGSTTVAAGGSPFGFSGNTSGGTPLDAPAYLVVNAFIVK